MLHEAEFVAFIPVGDLERARDFYVDTLGLSLADESPFALTVRSGSTTLRLTAVPDLHPQQFTIAGWLVSDVAAAVDALASAGITFTRYDGMDQDERGIWTTPGGDRVAWFTDPDGNTLSLTTLAEE